MTMPFKPRIPGPWPMPHLEHRSAAVQALGWAPDDAHWLALVCLYSGVFTRLQYRDWHHRDKYAARRFVQRLTAAGVAREHPLPARRTPQRFCHVFGRSLYRALGIEHAHQRRLGSPALLWRRLLTLDCLLAHPDANWLATGEDKLLFFLRRGYDEEDLPQRRLGDRALDHVTLHPIAVDERRVSFVFPDPGHGNTRALYYWASDHLFLWEALRLDGVAVEVIVAVRDDRARNLYEETLFRWTPAGAGLNEDERSFLEAIQAARRHPDPDEIGRWLGWVEADDIEARLRPRLHQPPARIDRYAIHFAERRDDSELGL